MFRTITSAHTCSEIGACSVGTSAAKAKLSLPVQQQEEFLCSPVTAPLMRYRLLFKNVTITRQSWNARASAPAQQRYLRVSARASGSTGEYPDSNSALRGTYSRTASTAGVSKEQSDVVLDTPRLPLSPLLDPELLTARNRYKIPKPEPSGQLSTFQQKLQKNPFGTLFS